MNSNLKIGFRNLGRNKRRTLLALTAVAVAQATLIWLTSFMNGYHALVFETLTGPWLGHIQLHAQKYRDDNAMDRVMKDASVLKNEVSLMPHVVNVSERIYAPALAAISELGHAAMIIGIDTQKERKTAAGAPKALLEGLKATELPGSKEVLIGKYLAAEMRAKVGDTVALMGQARDGSIASGLFTIKGILKSDVEQVNRAGIVMDLPPAQELLAMGNEIHELAIQVDDTSFVPAVMEELKENPRTRSLDIVDWQTLSPAIAGYLEVFGVMNLIILFLVFLTTSTGIANTMLMATFERKHEFGMLMALGCKPSRLILILMLEATILGICGVLIGSGIGISIVLTEMQHGNWLMRLSGSSGLSFSLEGLDLSMIVYPILKFADIARSIGAVVVTSFLATLWPARRIVRFSPIEAMRL